MQTDKRHSETSAYTSSRKTAEKKSETWRTLAEELDKCGSLYAQPTTGLQEVYYESLKRCDPKQLQVAFERCRKSLVFFPKIADVLARYSSGDFLESNVDRGALVRTWEEPMSRTAKVIMREFANGSRTAQVVPR
jgi:hypothetical protein